MKHSKENKEVARGANKFTAKSAIRNKFIICVGK